LSTNSTVALLRIALIGGRGRTGQAISRIAPAYLATITAMPGRHHNLRSSLEASDVVLDFSSPEITRQVIETARALAKPLVIGTTGHAAAEKQSLLYATAGLPVVWSGNDSVGVNLLFSLVKEAATALDRDHDIEILETHHRFKLDAPSGTAVRLTEILRETEAHGAGTMPGTIRTHAVRAGDVVGDHTVVFAGIGERLELSHRSTDRTIFAHGALRAAHWILRQPAGIYTMQDVLGLT
jgi:4-hydroxy-tetrahydrodipicolinate reductase